MTGVVAPTGLHADAVAVLTGYSPAHSPAAARQADLRAEYLRLLAERGDATWRECTPAHLTASVVVLDAAGARVLLVLHRKARLWLQLGGHCEPGDASLAAAALREATEESGVAGLRLLGGPVMLDRHAAPCGGEAQFAREATEERGSDPSGPLALHHYDVMFAAVAPPGADARMSSESTDIGWFALDALPEPTDGALRALVAAGAERFRRELS